MWVPNCGDYTLSRVDLKTGVVTATIQVAIGDSEGRLAVGAGAVWLCTDPKGVLARIDPSSNKVVAEIKVQPRSFAVACDESAVWATSTEKSVLMCIDPRLNQVVQQFAGAGGDEIQIGKGSVWLSNLRAGNVWRLDPNKIEATRP